jgi:hypothetical protein
MTRRFIVTARVRPAGEPFTVNGMVARTLLALEKAGAAGCTAHEVASWAFRLGAYVHELRRDNGLSIQTVREEHPGGWHARYVLHSPVDVLTASEG